MVAFSSESRPTEISLFILATKKTEKNAKKKSDRLLTAGAHRHNILL
jgi:hypothetical protein